ncbi:MAG: hypothetical protein LBC71_08990 [Oscillospiraceae bacterium]|nr:hypothetical protein [Oscillospiraceae bacterium]
MKILNIFIILIILASVLTGCRSNTHRDFELPEYVFVPEVIPIGELSGGLSNINNIHISEGVLYFTSSDNWGRLGIYMMDFDGSNMTSLPNFTLTVRPDIKTPMSYVSHIHVDNSGYIYVVERIAGRRPISLDTDVSVQNTQNDDNDFPTMQDLLSDLVNIIVLRKFDVNGTVLLEVDLTDNVFESGQSHLGNINIDDDGNIYLTSFGNIYVLNKEGRLLFTLTSGHGGFSREWLIKMSDGSISMVVNHRTGVIMREIDFQNETFGESMTITVLGEFSIYQGNEQFSLLLSNALYLYGLDENTGELVEILNWVDSDILSLGVDNIILQSNDHIIITRANSDFGERFVTELVSLQKTPSRELPRRINLTLATFNVDKHREAVIIFNRSSTTHRIHILDYSIFNTRDDITAGLTRLTTEIITGKIPDILDVTHIPFVQYATRGMFVDLYSFIENDSELNRDDFMSNVLRATEIDGQLYRLFETFSISTLVGNPDILGYNRGWNIDEFIEVINENPQAYAPLGESMSKESFLKNMFIFNMEQFINWDTGTAHFDTNEFIQLLELTDFFPLYPSREFSEYAEIWEVQEMLTDNKQIMFAMEFRDFQSFLTTRTIFGGEIVFKGFPTEIGNGSAFIVDGGLAITNACMDKQGAWEFLRTFLLEDWQKRKSEIFPINNAVFERHKRKEINEAGDRWSGGPYGNMIHIPNLTEDEANQIMALIYSIDHVISADTALWDIVIDSATNYFNGQATIQDTVRIIQSRASTYMSERSG